MRGTGDGFLACSDGQMRWGIYGAAGVLFVVRGEPDRVMLQLRSQWSHGGGTWAIAGGALDLGETPIEGALREATEEIGGLPAHRIIGEYVFAPADNWSYTTVIVEVDEPFGSPQNFETDAVDWVVVDQVGDRMLHPGFRASWPDLRELLGD